MRGTRKHSLLRPSGVLVGKDDSGNEFQRDTIRCVHCQRHAKWQEGKFGWCPRCAAFICPRKECSHCLHWERKLELLEAGVPRVAFPLHYS